MQLYLTLAFRPAEMSQKFVHFSLRAFLLFTVFLADRGSGTFNITRSTKGDVFQRTNSSQSCNESGASCVDEGNSPLCRTHCCKCVCPSKAPTYLLRNGNCTSEDRLMSILKDQSSKQGCDHRMVVAESYIQCQGEILTTLDTLNPGTKTLYLCPWSKKPLLKHFQLVNGFNECEIVPEESLFLNGTWQLHQPHDPALSKLSVEIGQDPSVSSDRLLLKWSVDLGKQYDGLIFSLKLKCRGKQGKELNSCVHFKKAGSFTDIKPTLKLESLKLTTAQSTSTSSSTLKLATAQSTSDQQSTVETVTTATMASTEKPTPSTAHVSTSPAVVANVEVTSSTGQPQINIVVVILAALAGTLFGFLAILTVVFLLWKRRRQFDVQKGAEDASNPVYARGASDTLKMSKIVNGNSQSEDEWLNYQPLVENTKPAERKDSLPGYRALSIGQRPNQLPTSNRVIRSSNYLSLLKDDPEDGREYQTLVKDPNAQNLEIVNEDKIPDYAEIEERSDSEDSFDSSDSKDYEEPPVLIPNNRPRRIALRRKKLNNLSSDFNDYDEPEAIIVISGNDDDSPKQAIKDSNDFHDYADPDDTDEDNVNCHVTCNEDLSCCHDYADPDYDDPEGLDS